MKWIIILLSCAALWQPSWQMQRICKSQVLRSFGLHGRITANTQNSLCPKIPYNCCTKRDQMKIHKAWNEFNKETVKSSYRDGAKSYELLDPVISAKDQYDLKAIIKKFEQYAKPSSNFMNHLTNIVGEYNNMATKDIKAAWTNSKGPLEKLFTDKMVKYRQAFFCNLCDWRNHIFYNPQSLTITYAQKFCTDLIPSSIDALSLKYQVVFRYINIMDEFMFLISGQRLLDPVDHAIFHRYAIITKKCQDDPKTISNCNEICRELNLNCYNYMWDGEGKVLRAFLEKYYALWQNLLDDANMTKLFSYRQEAWSTETLSQFVSQDSVLSKLAKLSPAMRNQRKNQFDLEFKSGGVKTFVEYQHPTYSTQVESLDDELSSFNLYKMAEPPVDICQFSILFDTSSGINLDKDSQEMNFDISIDQLLALLHTKGGDVKALDEIIETPVSDILKKIVITDIAGFINNCYIDFADVETVKPKASGMVRGLKHVGIIAAFKVTLAFILMLVG